MTESPPKPDKPLTKVAKYEVLKPEKWVGGSRDSEACSWKELGTLLRDVQYIESRVGNLYMSEKYIDFRLRTTDSFHEFEARKVAAINKQVRRDLIAAESFSEEELSRFAKEGALNSTVLDAFAQGVLRPQTTGKNWGGRLQVECLAADLQAQPASLYPLRQARA